MGPPIAGSPRVQGHREYVVRTIMHGLTGPLDDRTYTNVMVPMGAQTNDWMAAIASYVRNDFGNTGSVRDGGRRRARARRDDRTEDAVDRARNRKDASGARAVRSDLESDGQPQRRCGRPRADHHRVDVDAAPAAGHVGAD